MQNVGSLQACDTTLYHISTQFIEQNQVTRPLLQ